MTAGTLPVTGLSEQALQNEEAEEAVLGALLVNGHAMDQVASFLLPDHFADLRRQLVFGAMTKLYEKGRSIDLITVKDALQQGGMLEGAGGAAYVARLSTSTATEIGIVGNARIVYRHAVRRAIMTAAQRGMAVAMDESLEPDDAIAAFDNEVQTLMGGTTATNWRSLGEVLADVFQNIADRVDGKPTDDVVPTGIAILDHKLNGGPRRGDLVTLAARTAMGKAQPLDTPVLTTRGWKSMGELRIGDHLASVDGGASEVTGVYPQGDRQVYRVTFSDGRSTECCAEHLWTVHCSHWSQPRTIETSELMRLLSRKRYQNRIWIDTFSGEFGADEHLPVDPWVLGVLLGDGGLCSGGVRFSSADAETVTRMEQRLDPLQVVFDSGYDYRVVVKRGSGGVVNGNPLLNALRDLDLCGTRSEGKFIPPQYLHASKESRLELLQGLLDTDGWVEAHGSVCFGTASRRLAEDVVQLARSLGAICSDAKPRAKHCVIGGERKPARDSWVATISYTDPSCLFRLERKKRRVIPRRHPRRLSVRSISPSRVTTTQCIAVSHPSHLYVTEGYIVTHNTAFAVNIAHGVARRLQQEGKRGSVGIIELEMTAEQLAERFICVESRVRADGLKTGVMTEDEFQKMLAGIDRLQRYPVYLDDRPAQTVPEIRAKARRLKAEHGLDVLIVDHIDLIRAPSTRSKVEELEMVTMALKNIAKELDIVVIELSQLNREADKRADHEPQLSDLRNSGGTEQNSDTVLFLYRPGYYDEECDTPNVTHLIIAKAREGDRGKASLYYEMDKHLFHGLLPGSPGAGA